MNCARLLWLFVPACLLGACGGGEHDVEGLPSEPLPTVTVEAAPHITRPVLYDDAHDLLASDERVAGLTLPVGLTATPSSDERIHTYLSAEVPIGPLLRYFGPRLTTGQVEAGPGGGATYRNAIPREVEAGAVRMDVAILPVPGSLALVEIREIPPPAATGLTEEQAYQAITSAETGE